MQASNISVLCLGTHTSFDELETLNETDISVAKSEAVQSGLDHTQLTNADIVIVAPQTSAEWQQLASLDSSCIELAIIGTPEEDSSNDALFNSIDACFPAETSSSNLCNWLRRKTARIAATKQQALDLKAASQTATTAMSNASELGRVIHFIESTFELHSSYALAKGVFQFLGSLQLKASLLFQWRSGEEEYFNSETGNVPDTEKKVLRDFHNQGRIIDFNSRTLVNFPKISLLIKNMPIEDEDKYGRIKDLLPIMLAAVNIKLELMDNEHLMYDNACESVHAFNQFRNTIYNMAKNQNTQNTDSIKDLVSMKEQIFEKLPTLGLDEDQEQYIESVLEESLDKVATSFQESAQQTISLLNTVEDVKTLSAKLEKISEAFAPKQEEFAPFEESSADDFHDDDIELF